MKFLVPAFLTFLLLSGTACNYTTYTVRSRKNIQREKPSIVLLNKILDFRVEQNYWPYSREDFMSKGVKYASAFDGFPYTYTRFKTIDSTTMVFYFSGHVKDQARFEETQKVDMNSYGGSVRFYKEKGKFLWKLKMR